MIATKWNVYQEAIFAEVANGSGNVVVNSCAGSGKSTALIESLKYIPKGKTWLLVAFNKSIAEELKYRAPAGGTISTLHALGLKTISSGFPRLAVDNTKLDSIVKNIVGKGPDLDTYRSSLSKAVSFAKATLSKTREEIDDMLDLYDIELLDIDRNEFIDKTLSAIDACKQFSSIDFDDMCWGPNIYKLKIKTYDYVFVDEFQDLNKAQIEFCLKLCKKKGRIVLFGDEGQSIYFFRAADTKTAMVSIENTKPKHLSLSISYRCPVSVVNEAKKYSANIEAAPNAKQGYVDYISPSDLMKMAKPGCFIISRTNAPMFSLALNFIKMGVPANIRGRDIGTNLLGFIENSKCKDIFKLRDYIDRWKEKEVERLQKKQKDILPIIDKWECLKTITDDCKDVAQVKSRLSKLFTDENDSSKIILSSTHRVKGDQNPTVYLLWNTFFGEDDEANNLRYVAITRSQDKLFFVKDKKFVKKEDEDEF